MARAGEELRSREAADLFIEAMTELGHPPRSVDAVVRARIRETAVSLSAGRLAAEYAAEEVAALILNLDDGDDRAFRLLVLSDLWLDHPADRAGIAEQIASLVSEISA
ncbi:hypothetical protein AB0J82_09145 [Asanoa sp. NPDC049518]|uniref:hypothetical protein n=1 Tax=unclassified Asanoa TaxID=2685164 RepID=UPI003445CDA1